MLARRRARLVGRPLACCTERNRCGDCNRCGSGHWSGRVAHGAPQHQVGSRANARLRTILSRMFVYNDSVLSAGRCTNSIR